MSTSDHIRRLRLSAAATVVLCAAVGLADEPASPSEPTKPVEPEKPFESAGPATPSDSPAETPSAESDPLPSLDELLGLEEPESEDPAAAPADDQQQKELDRKLTAQDAADALNQALTLMDDTAARLGQRGGTGLETQRLQEDILRKLDTVIEAAEQNQGQGSGSSAGSQSRQSKPSTDPGQQQSGGAQSAPSRGEGDAASMPSEGGDAQLGPQRLLDASAWGALPDRLRDSVREGLSDKFSAAYRSLTEAYYRRLAEEAEGE